ncbi:MAG: hypothetical protein ACQXXH_07570 [Candidatus Bathyarchaeia archaeon]|jgi:hypothetical protein|nr:hypothetical protein [Candidatus Bathyarchaeota archaeon A05DMB-4]MDH7595871.1 hypothetical protein [Candidatus Bathyarchaeota archaeon]
MDPPSKKTLIPILLVSIILPVSLILGFNRTSEFHISREINVKAVEWNFTRPYYPYQVSKHVPIGEPVVNSHNDDVAAIQLSLFMGDYFEESLEFGDYILFRTIFSANLTKGFIYKLQIKFSCIDENVSLDILGYIGSDSPIETRNLSILRVIDYVSEPYVDAIATGDRKTCYLKMYAFWLFFDENNVDHGCMAIADLVIFNGSEYVKIQIPISLGVFIS